MRLDSYKIELELARRDIRKKRLAEISGISRATVTNMLSGKTVSPLIALKIAQALNMSVEQLLENGTSA